MSDYISYVCKSVAKPKMTVGETEHKFINHTFYYPGGVTYDPITITLVDPTSPSSTQALYRLLQVSGYRPPDQIGNWNPGSPDVSTISKRTGVGALINAKISQLNGDGSIVEELELNNAWIKSVDFGGNLSYENEGLVEIALELRFDWFTLDVKEPQLSANPAERILS